MFPLVFNLTEYIKECLIVTTKIKIKIIIDILMTIALMFLMGYQFWGDAPHEWIGATMFVLFIVHHLLNLGWYKNLFKGKYTPYRIVQFILNTLLLIAMFMQMYSGIVMSGHVFSFLNISGGIMVARRLHILGSFWGFVLMSLHLGLHWNMMVSVLAKKNLLQGIKGIVFKVIGYLIAIYGLYAFIKRGFPTYLFLRSEFVFMDFSEAPILFYLDYIAILGLFVFIGYMATKLFLNKKRELKSEKFKN